MKQGLFKATYGNNPVVEFIHVDNVKQALFLATKDLLKEKSKTVSSAAVYSLT